MANLVTDPNDPRLGRGVDVTPVKQHDAYLVLSDEERAKGFCRPVRRSYIHVGTKVDLEGELLSLEEGLKGMSGAEKYYSAEKGYGGYLKYPESRLPVTGKFMTFAECEAFRSKKEYEGGCNVVTTMSNAIAETYARDPKFYGSTYCCNCHRHISVAEFVWEGTTETVGS